MFHKAGLPFHMTNCRKSGNLHSGTKLTHYGRVTGHHDKGLGLASVTQA